MVSSDLAKLKYWSYPMVRNLLIKLSKIQIIKATNKYIIIVNAS